MLQEEALMIAEKVGISGFAASNGWLESFKKQHNLHHMTIAGEDGDVKDETIESWSERVTEITRGWKPEDVSVEYGRNRELLARIARNKPK